MAVIEVPSDYGYVVLVVVLYTFLNFWMASTVGLARRKYNVPYPTLYAVESENKDAKLFNCVQRGHQNSLEVFPFFLTLLLIGGLRHPCVAAGCGVNYMIGRFFYFRGYATGIPGNRLKILGLKLVPLLVPVPLLALATCTVSFGLDLLRASTV